MKLDHIAIAVENLEASIEIYESLGLEFADEREIVASEKVKTAFAGIGGDAHLELLEPTDENSSIAKFIDKKGAGIHHICFRVDNLKEKQIELEKKNMKFIFGEARAGANSCLVNFIHPKSTGGVLIELSEKIK